MISFSLPPHSFLSPLHTHAPSTLYCPSLYSAFSLSPHAHASFRLQLNISKSAADSNWTLCSKLLAPGLRLTLLCKLQALVCNILPSTTAVFSYTIGPRKLSANEQVFFVGAQTVVSLLQTLRLYQTFTL